MSFRGLALAIAAPIAIMHVCTMPAAQPYLRVLGHYVPLLQGA